MPDMRFPQKKAALNVRSGYVTGTTSTHGTVNMSETAYTLNIPIAALKDYTKAVVLPPHGGIIGDDAHEATVTLTLISNTHLRISFIATVERATRYYAIRYYIMELG